MIGEGAACRRWRSSLLLVVLTALASSCGAVNDRAVPSPSPSTSSPAPREAGLIAYTHQDALWVYDLEKDSTRTIVPAEDGTAISVVGFAGSSRVVYSSAHGRTSRLLVVRIDTGSQREIVRSTGSVLAASVRHDGARVAYVHIDHSGDALYRVFVAPTAGGSKTELRTLGRAPGRGASSEDEIFIDWSPNGSSILVVDTPAGVQEHGPSIWLIDREGKDITRPWAGTHARWSPDGSSIYFRAHCEWGRGQGWSVRDVASGRTRPIAMRAGVNDLTVSPDGKYAAYDTSWFGDTPACLETSDGPPTTYLFNLQTDQEAVLRSGGLRPLWISSSSIVLNDASGRSRGSMNSWTFQGTTSVVALDGTRRSLAMNPSYDAVVHPSAG